MTGGRNIAFAALLGASALPVTALTGNEAFIATEAGKSACAKVNWKDRGVARPGYFKGMAVSYGRKVCELKTGGDTIAKAIAAPAANKNRDALELYGRATGTDLQRLRAAFALAIGEGMRESSGNTTEGRDVTVLNPTPANAEAGLFQVSFDSLGGSPHLVTLYASYQAAPQTCLLELYMEGAKDKKAPLVGTGDAAKFQRFTKECPAFATDYAAIMFRTNRNHFGPIKNMRAKLLPVCEAMLERVEQSVTCD